MHIKVESKRYDSRPEAEHGMNQYYRNYHPYGYGTQLRVVRTPDGEGWQYVGTRWETCD